METKYCQSCGMPLSSKDVLGKDKDGSMSEDYCMYCYDRGEFTKDCSVEEMIETCIPFMVKDGFTEVKAREMMIEVLPKLKRWSSTTK